MSNNYISFQAGYVQVYGRRIYVESGTKISVSLDGTAYGYVIIKIDLGNNAITLEKNGMEVLIHIGVNTVNMQGEGFTAYVEEGAEVKAGQKLLGFDREAIKKAGYNDTVVMLLTNSDDLGGVECGLK